jgi:hypothetical protein
MNTVKSLIFAGILLCTFVIIVSLQQSKIRVYGRIVQ